MTARSGQEDRGPRERRGRSPAELVAFAISVILIVAVVGLAAYLSRAKGDNPQVIVAAPRTAEVRREANSYYLPIDVTNRGSETIEAVLVRAELSGAGEAQTAEVTIDFLASGETAAGTMVFATDPRTAELTVGVVSFLPP
jgi:uncharacterized protein (TIGR02588 family)